MKYPAWTDINYIHEALEQFRYVLPTGLSRCGKLSLAAYNFANELYWYDGEKARPVVLQGDDSGQGTALGLSSDGKFLCGTVKDVMFRHSLSLNETLWFRESDGRKARQAFAVNSSGIVAGLGVNSPRQGGVVGSEDLLRYPGFTRFYALTDSGIAAGADRDFSGYHQVKENSSKTFEQPQGAVTAPFGISDDGRFMAGVVRLAKDEPWQPAFWDGGKLSRIVDVEGNTFSGVALDVNSHGLIVGVRFTKPLDSARALTQGPRSSPFLSAGGEEIGEPFYCEAATGVAYPIGWFASKFHSIALINDDNLIAGYYRATPDSGPRPYTARLKFDKEPSSSRLPRTKFKKAAIIYDFDGTLAQGNMQEHSFIEAVGVTPEEFWESSNGMAREQDGDQILTYMREMLTRAEKKGFPITKALLAEHGAKIKLFNGVEDWFRRINDFARQQNLQLEHYIISSGIREMIRGSSIAHHFKGIFASGFVYEDDQAVWPALSINYTTKTQYLFRINKGIDNCWDDTAINKWMPLSQRPMPFENMIFLGDGETDIPTMKMVRHQGGAAVAVFDPERWDELQERIFPLISENRADFVASADYREGSQLELTIKGLLGRIALRE